MVSQDRNEPPLPSSPWNPPPHLEAHFLKRRRWQHSASPAASSLATTRRQLLLEARKSSLRARAQHVERVRRSRASEHDAVAARLLSLQANMNAAQKSRDAILAKIAGSCASEVAKAKRTAVEMRERREKETESLKERVGARMEEAERRRQEVLRERGRRKRSAGSAGSGGREKGEVRKVLEEEAARVIQRGWRNERDRKVVEGFVKLGLTIESVRDADFMKISTRFQDEEVLSATARLLKRCGLLEGVEGDKGAELKACRTYLSAYLILGHPAEVLSNDGKSEKDLITRSKDLLIAFESFLSVPAFPPPQALYTAWVEFSTAFDAWKSRDSEVFIGTMVAQYAELDLIWQKVKNDTTGRVADDYKGGIRENQLLLLVRIRRLAGDRTLELIRSAVKEARRTRLPKKEKRDLKPREIPSSEATTASTAAAMAQDSEPTPTEGQPLANSFEAVSDGGMLNNRQIIHELALDPNFRLERRKPNQLEQMVESVAKRAFWDTMREDMAEGKLEKWIPSLAETVSAKILRLLEPSKSLYREVSDSIDVQLIRQQCAAGSYDHEKLISYVLDLLPRICSPARDQDVQSLRAATNEEYTSRLQRLLDVLEDLNLDHVNFLLQVMKSQLLPQAIPYEQRAFAADLAAHHTTLTTTRSWLLNAKSELTANTPSKEVHTHAFLNLLFSDDPLPETMHLDYARIASTRESLRNITRAGAIAITTKTILRRDVRSTWKDLQSRITVLLAAGNTHEHVATGVKEFLESTTATPPATREAVQKAILRILGRGAEDPVVRVVTGRVRGFLRERLLADTSVERVRLESGAAEQLAGWGVGEWFGEMVGLTEKLKIWRGVDAAVCEQWYAEILRA